MNALRRPSGPDSRQVRLTEQDALTNVRTVLELCAAGEVKCSEKTGRPSAAPGQRPRKEQATRAE